MKRWYVLKLNNLESRYYEFVGSFEAPADEDAVKLLDHAKAKFGKGLSGLMVTAGKTIKKYVPRDFVNYKGVASPDLEDLEVVKAK